MDCQKHLFNLDSTIHYLNCARKGPLMRSAEDIAIQALIRDRNPGQISTEDFFSVQDDIRVMFGRLVNCKPSQLALLPSTSYGFASVLRNISPKQGGNAVILEGEFPSAYLSLKKWCDTNGNSLKCIGPDRDLVSCGESWNEHILDGIDRDTSLVLLSAVHWMSGVRFDLKSIGVRCKEVGARFLVDGTQSVGALPIDIEEFQIDALICAGYKWLFGPYSTAIGYFSEIFDNGNPMEESWMNRTGSEHFASLTDYSLEYRPGAARYTVGQSSNFILMPMLRESIRQILEWNPAEIQRYCSDLTQPLKAYMEVIGAGFEGASYFADHLFSFKLPDSVDELTLSQALTQDQIEVSKRGESLRISLNVFNDTKDIDALISCISRCIK